MATATRKTSNGAGPATKAKDALEGAAREVTKASRPLMTGGAVAAAFAGGIALGTTVARKRKRGGAAALAGVAALVKTVSELSDMSSELKAAREQLEQLNRRSPIEVVLDGLTHRRGAHRRES